MDENLKQAIEQLKSAGAEGVWLVRGAADAVLGYVMAEDDTEPVQIELAPPHEIILVARFPASDGGEAGIEHW